MTTLPLFSLEPLVQGWPEIADVNHFETEYEDQQQLELDFSVFEIEGLSLAPKEARHAPRILSSRRP